MFTYIKSALFMFVLYIFTTVYFIVGLPVLFSENLTYKYIRSWTILVIHLIRIFGVKSKIINRDKVPKGAAIICANHQSYYEIALLFSCLDKPVFILKSSLMKVPIYNFYLKKMGMIPVDRTKLNKNWHDLAIQQLKMGKQVIIFPEGTRVPIGRKISYKPGAFKLAENMNMKIYPVKTNSGEIWSGPGILKKSGEIYIKFHDPIDPDPNLLREKIGDI